MKHLTLYEAFPTVYAEPTYANQVFTIRYRATSDMSNKRGNDTINKPENDVLDDFAVGDIVSGKGKEDDKTHTGKVLRIDKDSDGENIGIFIEEDGKEVEILSSTVKMDTEVGNQKALDPAAINPIDKFDPTPTSPFTATTNESMKNLRAFGSFLNED